MPLILHINDKITRSGGVEAYIEKLLVADWPSGWSHLWLGVSLDRAQVTIEAKDLSLEWSGDIEDLDSVDVFQTMRQKGGLLHVHSLSEPNLLEQLFALAPIVRTIHEPRIFCPGQGKYWAKEEVICSHPAGFHCLYHAYLKQCCNRHPKRLWRQYQNTHYELRIASKRYARLLANSSYTLEEAIRAGVSPNNIELLHLFTPVLSEAAISADRMRLLYVGRLSQTKGVHYMLRAFALVRKSFPEVHLDILGSGHDEAAFHALAEELGLMGNLTFHGWSSSEQVVAYIERASLLLFPSIYPEAFGLSGIEALMRGKPVVGFDVGGVKDWLRHEETGLLVPVKDTQGFADAVIRVLDDEALRLRMGKRAREIALAEFSEEVHIEKLIQIYESTLDAS
jgi:glycosyltransferase involved in cell wall biosynthesis